MQHIDCSNVFVCSFNLDVMHRSMQSYFSTTAQQQHAAAAAAAANATGAKRTGGYMVGGVTTCVHKWLYVSLVFDLLGES